MVIYQTMSNMQSFPPTVVLRHRKENLKKCSLRGLEGRDDFRFFTYPREQCPPLDGYLMLAMDAPPLSPADAHLGLFVIDGTWRYADIMYRNTPGLDCVVKRSIPAHYRTAYPRRQDDCPDPERGLASIEAIYLAYYLLGRDVKGLFENYHWKNDFFRINGIPSLE